MSTYARTPLRAAIATAALAGALLAPAAAFAATPGQTPATTSCHVTKNVASDRMGMTVTLTNDLANGPKAELKDGDGKVIATVDRTHPTDLSAGIKLEAATGGKAVFFQRSQGGDTPWKSQPFPALPKECAATPGVVTYKLVNGETVAVGKLGTGHYRAEFVTNGKVVLILGTNGEDADGYVHGMHVVLNATTGKLMSEFTDGRAGCTVTKVVPSVFGAGMSVKLTNSVQGPKAVLRDASLKALATADRAHPVDGRYGVRIDGVNTPAPQLGQRTQGGTMPYRYTAFPKLPAGCANTAPAKNPATTPATVVNTPVQNGGQTTVVPKGAVAAGAEFKQSGEGKGLMIAGAAGAVVAAGAGVFVLRRRAGSTN